jgi:hypothetical protein
MPRLFFRKRWLFGRKRSVGLAICPQESYNSIKLVPKKEILAKLNRTAVILFPTLYQDG